MEVTLNPQKVEEILREYKWDSYLVQLATLRGEDATYRSGKMAGQFVILEAMGLRKQASARSVEGMRLANEMFSYLQPSLFELSVA